MDRRETESMAARDHVEVDRSGAVPAEKPSAISHIENNYLMKVGVMVRDIESAVAHYSRLFGIEPPTIHKPDPERTVEHTETGYTWYRGQFVPGRVKIANLQMGPVTLELLETFDEPGPWNEFVKAHGQGIFFITFTVPGFERHINLLEENGMPMTHKGEYGSGRYAYFDTASQLGLILGLQEIGPPLDQPVMPKLDAAAAGTLKEAGV
jgi:methylmalonyl-CoA/ethylmalonyl-CoA epimerase